MPSSDSSVFVGIVLKAGLDRRRRPHQARCPDQGAHTIRTPTTSSFVGPASDESFKIRSNVGPVARSRT
jgi:hypothetical protein